MIKNAADKNTVNKVILCGEIIEQPKFDHSYRGEDYYRAVISIKRESGRTDIINLLTKEKELPQRAFITGKLRSYTRRDIDKNRLIIYVQVIEAAFAEDKEDENSIEIGGRIVQPPQLRKTPLGKDICDLMVAVDKANGRADYIPCIVWGKLSHIVSDMDLGEEITIVGRMQSREYEKKIDEIIEIRTAFELSVFRITEELR